MSELSRHLEAIGIQSSASVHLTTMATPQRQRESSHSPSRQLLLELNQFVISSQDGFNARLDREEEKREILHRQALQLAAQKHERVRREAELERQKLEAEKEALAAQREEALQREVDRQQHERRLADQKQEAERKKVADERQRELDRVQREEQQAAERRRQEAEALKAEEERRQTAERQRQEAAKAAEARAKQEAEQKQRQQAEAAVAQQKVKASIAAAQTSSTITAPAQSNRISVPYAAECQTRHSRYETIHQELKGLRRMVTTKLKEYPEVKTVVGDMRRDIKKSVGQLTGENRKRPLATILDRLRKSISYPEPKVDITTFMVQPPSQLASASPEDRSMPAVLIYLLNIFSKAVVAQFISEAGVTPKTADPIGIVASHIFAMPEFQFQSTIPLVDILLSKMHIIAPALFGIYGSESTAEGKAKLGWWHEESRLQGPYIPSQRHYERMTGTAAGFAALTLRNYERVKLSNPLPDTHYWNVLARLVDLPSDHITPTHCVLLKALIEGYETKFIGFFGQAAVAAMRLAVVDLPRRCPPSIASKSLAGLADVLGKEKRLNL